MSSERRYAIIGHTHSGSGGGVALDLDDLGDVSITSPTTGDMLWYSAGTWTDTSGLLTWDGSTFQVNTGNTLRVYDPGDTDYIELKDSGSRSYINTNTNNLFFAPAGTESTPPASVSSTTFSLSYGVTQFWFDSDNSGWYQLQHDGTSFVGASGGTGTTSWQLDDLTFFRVSDGAEIRAYDAGNTTHAKMYHDGTDAYIEAHQGDIVLLAQSAFTRVDYLDLTPSAGPTHEEGVLWYDSTEKALSYYNDEADVTVNVGQENVIRVRNTTGTTITNGSAVYISGATGANLPNISLAQADALSTSRCIGLATHDIENNSNGYVTTLGLVRDLDTSSYLAGDTLFLSTSTPGSLTATRPTTGFAVVVGKVTVSNISTGEIKVLSGLTTQRADLTSASQNETISGAWTFDNDVVIDNGNAFRVYGPASTVYLEITNDGVDTTLSNLGGAGSINIADSVEIQGSANYIGGTSSTAKWFYNSDAQVEYRDGLDLWLRDAGFLRIYDSTDTDYVQFSHDGTDFNIAATTTTDINFTGATNYKFDGVLLTSGNRLDVQGASARVVITETDATADEGVWRFLSSGDIFYLSAMNDAETVGTDIFYVTRTGTTVDDFYFRNMSRVMFYGPEVRIYDSGLTDYASLSHDGTDFNFTFANTTDLNITGITAIQAGTVDADFDAITATSYGGIAEANLLDKTAAETISGDFTFEADTGTTFTRYRKTTSAGEIQFQLQDETNANAFLIRLAGGTDDDFIISKYDAGSFSHNIMTFDGQATSDNVTFNTGGGNFNILNVANFRLYDGAAFIIYDSTDTDSATFSHNGTDFTTTLANTTDWNIAHSTAGGTIKFVETGANKVVIDHGNDRFELRDGYDLYIYDSGDTDIANFNHDGTDFNTDFTNTTDWNINGLLGGATNNDHQILPQIQKYKDADTSRTSTTTLADDDDLAGIVLDADCIYSIDYYLVVSSASATPDYKQAFQCSQTPQASNYVVDSYDAAGTTVNQYVAAITDTVTYAVAANQTQLHMGRGFIHTHATLSTTLDLQWAQDTADATATTLGKGSWIRVTKMGVA